jgi:folate-dependent phosphoribosylglycinamide formyltransferase PurN
MAGAQASAFFLHVCLDQTLGPAMQPDGTATTDYAPRIALLFAGGTLGHIMANGLRARFPGLVVIQEPPEPKALIVKRRARLLGWTAALGQAVFGIAGKVVEKLSRAKQREIHAKLGLDPAPVSGGNVHLVSSVNSAECRRLLAELRPGVVAVYGTRILKAETLAAVPAPFINYHAGITPKYRGQNGAYWAFQQGDPEHAGITIHLVDRGVDTGAVLYQAVTPAAPGDNITTYQHRQMAAALPLVARAIEDALAGRLSPRHVALPSRQWFHPTLPGYVWAGVTRGVW